MVSAKPDCPLCRDGVSRIIRYGGKAYHEDGHNTIACTGPVRQGERRHHQLAVWYTTHPETGDIWWRSTCDRRRPNSGRRGGRTRDVADRLQIVPTTLSEANELVKQWHRHHRPTVGHRWSIAVALEGRLVGAAICGRPNARMTPQYTVLEDMTR